MWQKVKAGAIFAWNWCTSEVFRQNYRCHRLYLKYHKTALDGINEHQQNRFQMPEANIRARNEYNDAVAKLKDLDPQHWRPYLP